MSLARLRSAARAVARHLRERGEWYWAPLLYCAALAFIYRDVFFPGDGPQRGFGWDTIEAYWGDLVFMARSYGEGHQMFWNPYELAGTPFLGNPTAAPYYPVNWLITYAGAAAGDMPWWGIQLKMIGHHLIAACTMHLFLRARGLPPVAAAVGGLAWLSSAPLLIHKASALLWPLVWVPLLWLAIDRAVRRPSWRSGALLGGAVALIGSAGSPPGFFYVLIMAVPFGAFCVAEQLWDARRDRRALLRFAGSLGLALAIGAAVALAMLLIVVMPTGELTELSQRAKRSVGYALQFPIPARASITGMWAPSTGTHDPYLGVTIATLVVCALALRPLRQRGVAILFFVTGVFFLVLAFGEATPLLRWFVVHVPGFDLFRASNRYKLLAAPMFAVVAAYGLAALLDAARGWSRERITALAVATGAVVLVLLLLDAYPPGPKAAPKLDPDRSIWFASIAAALVAAIALAPRRFAALPAVLLLPLIVYDPQYFVHIRGPSLERRPDHREDERWLEGLADVRETWRVYDEFVLEQRPGSRLGIREFRGYPAGASLEYRRYGAAVKYLRRHPEILGEFNVRYVLHGPHRRIGRRAHHIKKPPDQLVPERFRRLRPKVFEVIDPAPVVAWYGAVHVARGPERVMDAMLRARGSDGVRRYAVLEPDAAEALGSRLDALRAASADPPPAVAGELVRFANTAVTFRVDAPADGVVVLNEVMYPGWRVEVDGKPARGFIANWMLRGVAVPAGEHLVTWRFRPTGYWWQRKLWWLGLIALLAAAVATRRRAEEA